MEKKQNEFLAKERSRAAFNESHKENPVVIDLTDYSKAETIYKKIYGEVTK